MRRLAGLLALLGLVGGPAIAQDSSPPDAAQADTTRPDTARAWHESAWTDIVTREGITVAYIFYQKADNQNNGVVLRLRNHNAYPVRYRFTVIFRGPEGEASAQASGRVPPRSIKTGENDGLFWVPFKDGRSIGEVGLRGLDVRRARSTASHGLSQS